MRGTVTTLRVARWTMLGSILVCAAIGEVFGSKAKTPDPALSYFFSTASVAIVGVIFVLRRTLVLRSAESLAANLDDALTLRHWMGGSIATYALCEALALFGLMQRFMGFNFQQSLPYYLGGFALLFFFGPREPLSS